MKKIKTWSLWWLAVLAVLLLTACRSTGGTDVPGSAETYTEDEGGSPEAPENAVPEEAGAPGDAGQQAAGAAEDAEPDAAAVPENTDPEVLSSDAEDGYPAEDAVCTSREDVAAYIHQYGHLPDNFITKKEAQELGWEGGSLEPYAPGMCIGGNRFGNYEGLLPEKDGRTYTECDIDTQGAGSRGAKRIVFSSDGLIYYTEDHYESFELLYGEEEP